MSPTNRAVALVALVAGLVAWHGGAAAQGISPNDAARFLAGMQPSAGSPLAALTRTASWQRHARWFDDNFGNFEKRQLSKVRAWSEKHLQHRQNTLYYMFSGPDFLYADAFYPQANTYLLSGLEPTGSIPNITERSISAMPRIQQAIGGALQLSFFITKNMASQLSGGDLSGTIPILYVYAARSGKTVHEASMISLGRDGVVYPAGKVDARHAVPGVKMIISSGDGPKQTLYYFRTDVSDSGVKASNFLTFAATLGAGNALHKSASYLMHSNNFSRVRDFVLNNSQQIVQDDSGIPLAHFKPDLWEFRPFGAYLGPIAIFPGRVQPKLGDLFRKMKAPPLDFGIGYRHRGHDSNLLLAVRKQPLKQSEQATRLDKDPVQEAVAIPMPPPALDEPITTEK
jgi:hypothetical protein